MKRVLFLLLFVFVCGCGYVTGGCMYAGQKIIVKPVVNNIKITSENREYANFETFPALIETTLTNTLIRKFNSDGNLKVVSEDSRALKLSCTVNNYTKETLRSEADDTVEEQRLRLAVQIEFTDADGEVLQSKTITGEATYLLNNKTEISARDDLIDDTARRIVESITEEW